VQTFREFAKHFNYVDLWALAHKEQHQPAPHLQQLPHSVLHPQPTRSDAPVAAVAPVAPSVAHVAVGTWNLFVQVHLGFREHHMRQHASAYVSICQHTSAAYVSIRQQVHLVLEQHRRILLFCLS
jgi:hypothetical protein